MWQKLRGIKREDSLEVVVFELGLKECVEFQPIGMENE